LASSYFFNSYLDLNNADENFKKIRYLIEKAAEIDPESGLVYYGKGFLNLLDLESEAAKQNFEKSLELIPNDAYANQMIAIYYSYTENRDLEKGLFYINRALELDPFSAIISEAKITILVQAQKIEEAEEFFNDKKALFSDLNKQFLSEVIFDGKMNKLAVEKEDWKQVISFCENEILKDPSNTGLYSTLGIYYDGIMNDDEKYVKYFKEAYEIDSTESFLAQGYVGALIESQRFEEAMLVMNSKNYKSIRATSDEMGQLIQYHYHKEEYELALEVFKDPVMENRYNAYKALSLAQIGNIKEVTKLLNKKDVLMGSDKAFVFAVLKNRDSMYFYMDKAEMNESIRINSRREVDPYRKEQRYIEFLKKNYMPITHWNK
jgi:tetratricopeptide (TPR) repeat protein